KIWCFGTTVLLGGLGMGCSNHPVTTGAAAYWEVAHVQKAEPRHHLEDLAAEKFHPSPVAFQPDLDPEPGYSLEVGMDDDPNMQMPEQEGEKARGQWEPLQSAPSKRE